MRILHLTLLFLVPIFSLKAETLEEAWQLALANNPKMNAVQASTQASEQQLKATENQQLPTLTVNGGYTQYSDPIVSNTQLSKVNVETNGTSLTIADQNVQFKTSPQGMAKAQAIVSMPIFTSGRISHNIDAASESLQAEKANESDAVSTLKMQVAEAYITVLRVQNELQITQSHLDSLTAYARDIKTKYGQGLVTGNDKLITEMDESNTKQTLLHINYQLQQAKGRYNQLLSRKLDSEVKLAPLILTQPTEDGLEKLTETAIGQREELEILNRKINMLTHQAQSISAEKLPQATLNGGYIYQQNNYQLHQGMWMANLDFQWKLFDTANPHRSDAASAQALNIKAQRDEMIGQISLQVQNSWQEISESQQRITLVQQAVTQAEENKRMINNQHHEGLSTTADVIKAEELLTIAQNNLNNARYDASLAIIRLQRAIGSL